MTTAVAPVAVAERGRVVREQLARQVAHWRLAAARLADFDAMASPDAWRSLEHYLGVSLRRSLERALARLAEAAARLDADLAASAGDDRALPALRARFLALRAAFLRTETTVDFYADAIAMRAVPRLAALLRACDHLATRSMAEVLVPLGREVPSALSYLDRGLGASVLKAGIRLWDGEQNPVAAIKVVRHNVVRPTALIHEAGHQVAHMLGWNAELRAMLRASIEPADVAELWAGWASELAADAFAFAHTGYASVAALNDVVDGTDAQVFAIVPGDPHPCGWLRVMAGVAMCRRAFGAGPWDDLAAAWTALHPPHRAPADVRHLVMGSIPMLPRIAELTVWATTRAFDGPLARLVDPARVSPGALAELMARAGQAAYSSTYWAWNEALRVLAATGYRTGTTAAEVRAALEEQERWMLRLGTVRQAA